MTVAPVETVSSQASAEQLDTNFWSRASSFWRPRLEILCGKTIAGPLRARLEFYGGFERAWYAARHLCGATDRAAVMRMQEFVHEFKCFDPGALNFAEILSRHVKGKPRTESLNADYQLDKLDPPQGGGPDGYPKSWNWRALVSPAEIERTDSEPFRYSVFMDAPAGFLLLHREVPCAFSCFFPAAPGVLMINSIQGVRGERYADGDRLEFADVPGCRPIRWREALVEAGVEYAKREGYRVAAVQGGANNRWVTETYKHGARRGAPCLELWQARRTYARTARCLGFSPAPDGNWYMAL